MQHYTIIQKKNLKNTLRSNNDKNVGVTIPYGSILLHNIICSFEKNKIHR